MRVGEPGVIVFAQGRTGSTLLCDLLDSHPDIKCHDEVLEAPMPGGLSPNLKVELLRVRTPTKVVGFHVKIYQLTEVHGLDPGFWLRKMQAAGWRVIWLRRDDTLRHTISGITAWERAEYERRGNGSGARQPVTVDPEILLWGLEQRTAMHARERAALQGIDHIEIVYERDLLDSAQWAPATARIFDHLGLRPSPIMTDLHKINAGPLSELVSNYNDVVRTVSLTEYERFLDHV